MSTRLRFVRDNMEVHPSSIPLFLNMPASVIAIEHLPSPTDPEGDFILTVEVP